MQRARGLVESIERGQRGISRRAVCDYLGIGLEKFRLIEDKLHASGFPAADPILGLYDFKAIERWWNCRSRLSGDRPAPGEAWLAALDREDARQ
jgi:hypothetical protein